MLQWVLRDGQTVYAQKVGLTLGNPASCPWERVLQ